MLPIATQQRSAVRRFSPGAHRAYAQRAWLRTLGVMNRGAAKRYAILVVIVVATALLLSALWRVPYVFTLIGFSAWSFFGHLVTADDDAPGGWSNPDGSVPFPWAQLVVKGGLFLALCAVAAFIPVVRTFGAAQ